MWTVNTLVSLGGCQGWSESSLGTQSLCWFCHVASHISLKYLSFSPVHLFCNLLFIHTFSSQELMQFFSLSSHALDICEFRITTQSQAYIPYTQTGILKNRKLNPSLLKSTNPDCRILNKDSKKHNHFLQSVLQEITKLWINPFLG